MAYDRGSPQAILGEKGNDRALQLVRERLSLRGSTIVVSRGVKNPAANGILGDILFSRPDEAPILGIEVKTSTARYPNSISLSLFEFSRSTARWLMAMNEDPSLGCWIQEMSLIRKCARPRFTTYSCRSEKDYYTSEPPLSTRIPLETMMDVICQEFGEP